MTRKGAFSQYSPYLISHHVLCIKNDSQINLLFMRDTRHHEGMKYDLILYNVTVLDKEG